jgi:hypothetical protein
MDIGVLVHVTHYRMMVELKTEQWKILFEDFCYVRFKAKNVTDSHVPLIWDQRLGVPN